MSDSTNIVEHVEATAAPESSELNTSDERVCWICYVTDAEGEPTDKWISPCNCRGGTKWVHEECLLNYIETKLEGDSGRPLDCTLCQYKYDVLFPPMPEQRNIWKFIWAIFVEFLRASVSVLLYGSIYWAIYFFGLFTIIQMLGYEDGAAVVSDIQGAFWPVLPALLVILDVIQEGIINCGYNLLTCGTIFAKPGPPPNELNQAQALRRLFPGIRNVEPNILANERRYRVRLFPVEIFRTTFLLRRCAFRVLTLPSIAEWVGNTFFRAVANRFERNMWGAAAFIMVKIIFRIYLKIRQSRIS